MWSYLPAYVLTDSLIKEMTKNGKVIGDRDEHGHFIIHCVIYTDSGFNYWGTKLVTISEFDGPAMYYCPYIPNFKGE